MSQTKVIKAVAYQPFHVYYEFHGKIDHIYEQHWTLKSFFDLGVNFLTYGCSIYLRHSWAFNLDNFEIE